MYDFCRVIQTSNEILTKRFIKKEEITVTDTFLNEEVFEIEDTNFEIKQEVIFDEDEEIEAAELTSEKTNFELKEEVIFDVDDDNKIEAPELKRERNDIFSCIPCDFSTSEYGLWSCHEKKHKKPRHACSICTKCGPLKHKLRNRIQHNLESPNMCLFCEKVYKHASTLRTHMKVTHENWLYPCKSCEKVYRHRKGYTSHLRQHKSKWLHFHLLEW